MTHFFKLLLSSQFSFIISQILLRLLLLILLQFHFSLIYRHFLIFGLICQFFSLEKVQIDLLLIFFILNLTFYIFQFFVLGHLGKFQGLTYPGCIALSQRYGQRVVSLLSDDNTVAGVIVRYWNRPNDKEAEYVESFLLETIYGPQVLDPEEMKEANPSEQTAREYFAQGALFFICDLTLQYLLLPIHFIKLMGHILAAHIHLKVLIRHIGYLLRWQRAIAAATIFLWDLCLELLCGHEK